MKRRLTKQKKEILSSVKSHSNAEKVYQNVKKTIPNITLATVYRNLNLLAQEGKILRFEVNKEHHYDANTNAHQHFVCLKTGKIYDLHNPELEKMALKKINKNFKPERVEIIYYGQISKGDKK